MVVCVFVYMCVYMYMCVCVYVCVCVCVCVRVQEVECISLYVVTVSIAMLLTK